MDKNELLYHKSLTLKTKITKCFSGVPHSLVVCENISTRKYDIIDYLSDKQTASNNKKEALKENWSKV